MSSPAASPPTFPLPPSLWAATAPPGPPLPPLDADREAGICIIGGGFTGLSAALHLAEAGMAPVLLEAGDPGHGASGRNGGQVIPGLKPDPAAIIRRFGPAAGRRLIDWSRSGPDLVFDLIARHGIDCAPVRAGWIRALHTDRALRQADSHVRHLQDIGAPVRRLDRDEMRRLLGGGRYVGGWIDAAGGSIQPLAFARGLARAARAAGAAIHGGTPALGLERVQGIAGGTAGGAAGWIVHATGAGGRPVRVRAARVLLCTNGYGDLARRAGGRPLWPGLARSVVPIQSAQVASRPLSDALRRDILAGGQVTSDSRRLLLYFRMSPDGRLVMGGRGGAVESSDPAMYRPLIAAAEATFPPLRGIDWDYRWGGAVAVTPDQLPHLHTPAPGLLAAQGFNGRGVALATAMGRLVARRLAAGDDAEPDPLPPTPIRPIRLHAVHRPMVALIARWYEWCDRRDARRQPAPMPDRADRSRERAP